MLDHDLVADVREAWAGLSRACHHHSYELAPTGAELRRWWETVRRFTEAVGQRTSPRAPRSVPSP